MRLRRSCLAVPASNPRMMGKAAGLDADEVFFDLEDACAPSEKETARGLAVEALRSHSFGRTTRAVRVNDLTTQWAERDVVAVLSEAADELDALIVPKVEDGRQVEQVDLLIAQVERELGRKLELELELQIESARGAVNIREIAQASSRIAAIVFGPGDYAASMGIPQPDLGTSDRRYPGHQWHWIMCEIAVHARAVGAQAVDGPFADFGDEEGFRESALRARLLGFDGKWCIHPNQIPWANEVFSPNETEVEAAEAIVAAYESALGRGEGAVAVDGKLVDEASRKLAEATLARARAASRR